MPSEPNLHANTLTYSQADPEVLSKLSTFKNVSLALPFGYLWAPNSKLSYKLNISSFKLVYIAPIQESVWAVYYSPEPK